MDIAVSPRRVLRFLLVIIATLTVLHVCVVAAKFVFDRGNLFGFARLFNLDLESNVPTYFSALQLALAALVLLAIGRAKRATRQPFGAHWLALAAIFAYLSVDEATMIHERVIGDFLRDRFVLTGAWHYAWYMVYGALLIVLAAAYRRFFLCLPRWVQYRFAAAAAVFLAGSVGMEMIASYVYTAGGWAPSARAFRMALAYSFEEPMEMIGIALFVYTALAYAAAEGVAPRFTLRIDPSSPAAMPTALSLSTASGVGARHSA